MSKKRYQVSPIELARWAEPLFGEDEKPAEGFSEELIAAYEASVWGIVYEPDLSGREGELIQAGLDNSVFDAGIVPEAEDRILTLSTCTRGKQEVRWVVQARLAYGYERT